MPPHGGHHHGGGHHHHHGHGGGGFTNWYPGWGPGWYADPGYSELVVVPQCPGTLDPVIGADGKTYNNPCEARAAGVAVVRKAKPGTLGGLTDMVQPSTLVLLAGAGVAAYLIFFQKKQRQRSSTRTRIARIRRIARSRR